MDVQGTDDSVRHPEQQTVVPLERATFWQRLFAYIIDLIVLAIIDGFVGLIAGPSRLLSAIVQPEGLWSVLTQIILALIPAIYFILPYSTNGQTLGKRALKIKVVSIDGSPLNMGKGILRTLGYIPSYALFSFGFLWSIWDAKKQAWHDKLAGSCVVPASLAREQLQGTIETSEVRLTQKRWLLGLGIPTLLILVGFSFLFFSLVNKSVAEVREMSPWPGPEVSPEELIRVDLSSLGLELEQIQNARDQDSWAGGNYEEGVFATYNAGTESVVAIWALRYEEKQSARNDFHSAQAYAAQPGICGRYSYAYIGNSGVMHCQYSDAYEKLFLNDYWIVNIVALEGTEYTPDVLVDQVRDAIAAHWSSIGLP